MRSADLDPERNENASFAKVLQCNRTSRLVGLPKEIEMLRPFDTGPQLAGSAAKVGSTRTPTAIASLKPAITGLDTAFELLVPSPRSAIWHGWGASG